MSVDSPIRETRIRRLAIAAAAVVAVIGAVAISINLANSEDDAPTPAVATVAPPTASTPTTVAIATTTEPVGVPGDFPDGTYRVEVTNSDLDAVNAKNWHLAGTWEWTFHAGDWSYQNSSTSALVESTYSGTYVVDGDHITLFVPGYLWSGEQGPNEFTWHANPDGSVQLGWLATTEPNWAAILASHPLVPTP